MSNNRDAYEALVQDLQGSGVAVSHQKYDIFNGDRFPHACCGTVMFMCRWRRRHCRDEPLQSWGYTQSHGRASRAGFCGFTHLSTLSPDACRDVFGGLKMPDTSPAERYRRTWSERANIELEPQTLDFARTSRHRRRGASWYRVPPKIELHDLIFRSTVLSAPLFLNPASCE